MADPSARPPTLVWALTGLDGRIGREVYWLGHIGSSLVGATLVSMLMHPRYDEAGFLQVDNGGFLPVVLAAVAWISFALAVKRLHDMALSGWLAATLFVPFIGVIPLIVIGMMPGTPDPNPFGPASNRRGVL